MKTIIYFFFFIAASQAVAQVSYQVKMAETPQANPKPLLKLYGNKSSEDYDYTPTYYPPASQNNQGSQAPKTNSYRITGYRILYKEVEEISLMVESTINSYGAEELKVMEYKMNNSTYWQKMTYPAPVYSNVTPGSTSYYNYKILFNGDEVVFHF